MSVYKSAIVEQGPWFFPSQSAEQEAHEVQYRLLEGLDKWYPGTLEEAGGKDKAPVVAHDSPWTIHYTYYRFMHPWPSGYGVLDNQWKIAYTLQIKVSEAFDTVHEEAIREVPYAQKVLDFLLGESWY